MNDLATFYESLAALFDYPDAEYAQKIFESRSLLESVYAEKADVLAKFEEYVKRVSLAELEELYVATFDVQSSCCLDVGYSVFGEDYKRGQFMAELKVLYRDKSLDCGTELPDHLPNVLRLLTRLDYASSDKLVSQVVVPALNHIIQAFGDSQNAYRYLLETVQAILVRDFSVLSAPGATLPKAPMTDFYVEEDDYA